MGCGVARITRHIPLLISENINVVGADINKEMIKWNSANIPNIKFIVINYLTPTSFKNEEFDLVFASVFTHIEAEYQLEWVKEIYRILSNQGIFYFTTHGRKFESYLNKNDLKILKARGSVTKSYRQKGHRMMTTYNTYNHFQQLLQPYFTILEYYDGLSFPEKLGGQDMWIVRKQ